MKNYLRISLMIVINVVINGMATVANLTTEEVSNATNYSVAALKEFFKLLANTEAFKTTSQLTGLSVPVLKQWRQTAIAQGWLDENDTATKCNLTRHQIGNIALSLNRFLVTKSVIDVSYITTATEEFASLTGTDLGNKPFDLAEKIAKVHPESYYLPQQATAAASN